MSFRIIIIFYCSTGENVITSFSAQSLEENQTAFIGLPQGLLNEITTDSVGLVFTFYSDASFFPFKDKSNRENITSVIGTAVIGGIVANETITRLEEEDRITVTFVLQDSVSIISNFLDSYCRLCNNFILIELVCSAIKN